MIPSNNSAACSVCFGSGFDMAGKPCPFAPHRDAATLKAAQGGVTEAMVESALEAFCTYRCNTDDAEGMMRAALEAALSAEPAAQGDEVIGYITADNLALLKSDDGSAFGHMTAPIYSRARSSREIPLYTAPPAQPAERGPSVCDGKEQDAFEAWARSQSYNMTVHPLHWLFLDKKTYAARQGWKGALEYVASLTASPAPSEGGKGVDRG